MDNKDQSVKISEKSTCKVENILGSHVEAFDATCKVGNILDSHVKAFDVLLLVIK